jgi:hypothetical protein
MFVHVIGSGQDSTNISCRIGGCHPLISAAYAFSTWAGVPNDFSSDPGGSLIGMPSAISDRLVMKMIQSDDFISHLEGQRQVQLLTAVAAEMPVIDLEVSVRK